MWETIFFWVFAIGALVASLAVVLIPKNPLYNALALIVDFFFIAGLYGLLSAHFLAVVQILVYGGAIMVLFMFIIMLLNIREKEGERIRVSIHQVVGVLVGCAMFSMLFAAFSIMIDQEAVQESRATYQASQASIENLELAESQKLDKTKIVKPILETKTDIPGLKADLNEAGVNAQYERTLLSYAHGTFRPANGQPQPGFEGHLPKYREFDPTTPVTVPEQLKPIEESHIARRKPSNFGTVEPIAVLLVNRFVVPFELTAILLLAAVVGAFIIAKKRL